MGAARAGVRSCGGTGGGVPRRPQRPVRPHRTGGPGVRRPRTPRWVWRWRFGPTPLEMGWACGTARVAAGPPVRLPRVRTGRCRRVGRRMWCWVSAPAPTRWCWCLGMIPTGYCSPSGRWSEWGRPPFRVCVAHALGCCMVLCVVPCVVVSLTHSREYRYQSFQVGGVSVGGLACFCSVTTRGTGGRGRFNQTTMSNIKTRP